MWAQILADSASIGISNTLLSSGALGLLGLILAFQAKSSRDATKRAKEELVRLTASRAEEELRRQKAENEKDEAEDERDLAKKALVDAQWHIRLLEQQIQNQRP